jgi:subtilisin family serine protease
VIVRNPGAEARYLHLNAHRGVLSQGTDGQITGHAAAGEAFAVAAVDVFTALGGEFVGGPSNPVEFFSSDEPRRIFFQEDGTPITPGNFLSTGGELRLKPDLAAADGVSTATPGFSPFYGTSAAAPHAAALAALLLEADPTLTPAALRDRGERPRHRRVRFRSRLGCRHPRRAECFVASSGRRYRGSLHQHR